jgi:hypothetical protein
MHVTPRTIPCASPASIPAVYAFRYHVASGDLISYGPDTIDPYRRAAGYIDRILKGEKPTHLPVQHPPSAAAAQAAAAFDAVDDGLAGIAPGFGCCGNDSRVYCSGSRLAFT